MNNENIKEKHECECSNKEHEHNCKCECECHEEFERELEEIKTPKTFKIKKIISHNEKTKTFILDFNLENKKKFEIKPGQFLMVWLPGIDEKPFACTHLDKKKNEIGFTVEEKGNCTKKMLQLKEGDLLGVRGPYGNGFEVKDNACIVSGGLGSAALIMLAEKLMEKNYKFDVIMGARSKELLLFKERFKAVENKKLGNLYITTDDGSEGKKGFASELLEKLLKEDKIEYKTVYVCGPEIMMKNAINICMKNNVECFASMERYMKCGFGVCGQCAVNDLLVCEDGPVFIGKELMKRSEFGEKAKLKSGKKVGLKEYHEWRSD